ncbi:hypothetical protein Nepgr_027624 [Nepenthes gracilis]|uniref:Protein LONGIFOLIA 1 n=1 Tax=Nepenthes gracilis TaxID=150966 RepID=A0AAD3TAU2_NEPGR|nr:hypothetical protein Nepgr_027624 [Nepenthes gracilis]
MTTGILHDQNLEKHIEKNMGCMAGFFNLFDRTHILAGKRFYSKRLPSSPVVDSASDAVSSVGSPGFSRELENPGQSKSIPSPDSRKSVVQEFPTLVPTGSPRTAKSSLAVPSFELKEGVKSPWKFTREAPRLSLDSRAVVDAKGSLHPREIRTTNASILSGDGSGDESDKQRRSPSVIARLMGLEPLRHTGAEPPEKKVELRRSASESRSRDLLQYRFMDAKHLQYQQQAIKENAVREFNNNIDNIVTYNTVILSSVKSNHAEYGAGSSKSEALKQRRSMQQRKSYYDSTDFFPEPKRTVSVHGEIEKRLKMRGIEEPTKDLETLKQILDSLQLKGLLHSKRPEKIGQPNFIYDRRFADEESPIIVIKPSKSTRRLEDESPHSSFRSKPVPRRNPKFAGVSSPSLSPRREQRDVNRSARIPTRNSNSMNSPGRGENLSSSPVTRRKALHTEPQRKENGTAAEQRRVSPVQSPKVTAARRSHQTTSRSPRNRRPSAEIYLNEKPTVPAEDESSTISESSYSTSSHADTERWKAEENKEGRSLLERCDKLLHSIAEMNATTELQPSPVSVLDSSFDKDDDAPPSPVMKRTINFKDQPAEFEDEVFTPSSSAVHGNESDGADFIYVSDILRASNFLLPRETDVFLLLEKEQYLKGNDTSRVSTLRRKLIFDATNEILDRSWRLPPWKLILPENAVSGKPLLSRVWSEFQRIQQPGPSEDLFDTICGVLRKDLAADLIDGWGQCPVEVSEAVLDIERLIFKDLIGETIRELAASSRCCVAVVAAPRRKLVF